MLDIYLYTHYTHHISIDALLPSSSRGLGHFPFTEVTGIRIPLGVYIKLIKNLYSDSRVLKVFK